MLKEKIGISRVFIRTGYTDLRLGIDGLACLIQNYFHLNPFDEGTLFLFCGRSCDRIKCLLWEGDGFLLLYKRLGNGRFHWSRNNDELIAGCSPDDDLNVICKRMGRFPDWMPDFLLFTGGYKTGFYKKTDMKIAVPGSTHKGR